MPEAAASVNKAIIFEGGVDGLHGIQNGIRVESQIGVRVIGGASAHGIAPNQGKIGGLAGFAPGKLGAIYSIGVAVIRPAQGVLI